MSAKTGRPKSEGPIRSATIHVKVTPAQKRQIEVVATKAGKSASSFISDIVLANLSVPAQPVRPAEQTQGTRAYVLYEQGKKVPAPGTKNQAIFFELTPAEAESRNRQLESEGSLRRYAEKQ
jgi:hypothetical protein